DDDVAVVVVVDDAATAIVRVLDGAADAELWAQGHERKIALSSLLGTVSRTHVNPPLSRISRAPRRKAASASRDSAPPTLIRLTPTPARASTVSAGSAALITTLTGLLTDDVTVRIVARSRTPGAYSTSAPAFSKARSRLIVSSRSSRPCRRFSARAVSRKGT